MAAIFDRRGSDAGTSLKESGEGSQMCPQIKQQEMNPCATTFVWE